MCRNSVSAQPLMRQAHLLLQALRGVRRRISTWILPRCWRRVRGSQLTGSQRCLLLLVLLTFLDHHVYCFFDMHDGVDWQTVEEEGIDCNFQYVDGYLFPHTVRCCSSAKKRVKNVFVPETVCSDHRQSPSQRRSWTRSWAQPCAAGSRTCARRVRMQTLVPLCCREHLWRWPPWVALPCICHALVLHSVAASPAATRPTTTYCSLVNKDDKPFGLQRR